MRWAPFKLERFFARYEFEVEHVLCASDCESMTIGDLLDMEPGAHHRFEQVWLGYTESAGDPELREAIARIYSSIEPDQILVHSGAEEAIFLFMHALLAPGDQLVVQWPCYQSLAEIARGLDCEVALWRGTAASGWAPDLEALPGMIGARTRAIVINSPHNPTGHQLDRAAFGAVLALAEARGCVVFSDEVYRESEYRAADRLPAACDLSENAVSLGVMSKTYGLPGLRIGWVATHRRNVLARMAQLKDYTTICNAAPSEFLATVGLRHRDTLVARSVGLLRENLPLVDQFLAQHSDWLAWRRPDAGPIGFVRLKGPLDAMGADEACERLAREEGILLLPGTVYDVPDHVRIGFGRRDLANGLNRLAIALERWG